MYSFVPGKPIQPSQCHIDIEIVCVERFRPFLNHISKSLSLSHKALAINSHQLPSLLTIWAKENCVVTIFAMYLAPGTKVICQHMSSVKSASCGKDVRAKFPPENFGFGYNFGIPDFGLERLKIAHVDVSTNELPTAKMEHHPEILDNNPMAPMSPEDLHSIVNGGNYEQFLETVAASESDEERIAYLANSETNIFHIAASKNTINFIPHAIEVLPARLVHQLLCQQDKEDQRNPLHIAARKSDHNIVKSILDFYKSHENVNDTKPWLQLDARQCTPLHSAMSKCSTARNAFEILSMDVDLLSGIEDEDGQSPLYLALQKGFHQVALQILTQASDCSLSGHCGCTAIFEAPICSEQIFRLVLEKNPELIVGKSLVDGTTMLHRWVEIGKLYPFEYVVNSNTNPPHLKKDFIDQLSAVEDGVNHNPLHYLAESGCVVDYQIAQVLVNAYKQERPELMSLPDFEPPWLVKDASHDYTPLHQAIVSKRERLALYLFSLDKIKFLEQDCHLLFSSIKGGCPKLVEEILDMVFQDQRFMHLLYDPNMGENALFLAPLCTEAFLRRLVEAYPELIGERSKNRSTILHSWIKIGESWPIEYILRSDDINPECRKNFLNLTYKKDIQGRNPLDLLAMCSSTEAMVDIAELFLDEAYLAFIHQRSEKEYRSLEIALSNRCEDLALLFLTEGKHMLDIVLKQDILFKAVEYKCHQVVKFLLEWSAQCDDRRFLTLNSQNILHVACNSTEENGRLMVENWPDLINKGDEHDNKPLDIAFQEGKTWLVELILQKDRTAILQAPLAWVKACKNGHMSTVLAFVDNSPYFRYICQEFKETPLHHFRKIGYKEYQKLLEHKLVNEVKNIKNKDGDTPLHYAIKSVNKDLVEVLLGTNGVDWSIRNNEDKTAMKLLKKMCKGNTEWATMCETIGVDPKFETTYIQVKTNLNQMRETISLVAALLATITFTAGFTVPGGFNNDNGEAILMKRSAFLVFLIADTYAMCCSMLILFCVIWSMVCNKSRSSSLLDRSLGLLKHSLYGTLLAFMAGVYSVVHEKSLWAATLVIVMCSFVVLLAQRCSLYEALDLVNFLVEKEHKLKKKLLSIRKSLVPSMKNRFSKGKEVNGEHKAGAGNLTIEAESQEHPIIV